ncbi:hypothetical protein GCM10010123_03800 [Pilimelia anulata]|uniref:Uncharacterized protein n=1 Tax=Pilimelia anulata TaxID=53371 RepID=A0A8J3F8B6_9ACTN|nr:hypothetical protein [Pilimelia anulata]GGJ77056.1 hypothetical protein GCM10010123_03800 [Pilimelia anulata]
MAHPHPAPRTAPVAGTRRALLRAAALVPAAAVAAGCRPGRPAAPDPLTGLLAGTVALAALYARVIETTPALAARLAPVRAAHEAHAAALTAVIAPPTTPPAPPPGAAPTVATLRRAERTGQRAAAAACLAAPAARATLLGEIAAARATHLEVLA